MCYRVTERYSICRCLYYKHSIDFCAAFGTKGHPVQERIVLVGYSCDRHSNYRQETLLWSSGSESTTSQNHHKHSSESIRNVHQGVKITSSTALRALEDAQLLEDDDTSTERLDESVVETVSTQTTAEQNPHYEFKPQTMSFHTSNLNDLRSRLRYPSQYITSLQELEEKVWNNSTISIYTTGNSGNNSPDLYKKNYGIEDYIPYPLVPAELQDVIPNRLSDDPFAKDPTNTSDEEITALCQSAADRTISSQLNAIRMCRNVILRTFLNLRSLQQANFCAGCFSIIVLDKRRRNVAILLPIENTDFIALVYELEYILRDSASLVLSSSGSEASLDIDSRFTFLNTPMIKQYCKSLLQMNPESLPVSDLGVVNVLRVLVLMLDLAVASYAGAHCSDFLGDIFSTNDAISLLAPFKDCSDKLKKSSVNFRRCNLQCLDAFHLGRGVGVFCPPGYEPSLPLYLSATIDSFSDIWGPLWKLKDQNNPDKYSAYVVGSGSIVQWQYNPLISPELIEERFCRWMCNEELEDGIHDKPGQGTNFPYIPFDGMERLLIGAPTNVSATTSPQPWVVNPKCSIPISEARTRLREAGRLCIVGALKPYHYNDSNQYQLQVGYSGVNASATRQYKRVPGRSLKEILIELWAMEPEIRDPKLLEDLHGVEISMCTHNAQRVSLAQVLRLKCMHHLLRDFNWQNPDYREEHFLTLEDTLRPKRLLDAQFKEKFDYAVMLGLKMLSKTGVDREDNLRIFLSSTCTPKPELATMVSKEHSWIGLLKDTTTECAMAAFGDTCLEFKYRDGISCGRAGHSALRSAMIPHSSMCASSRQMKLLESAHSCQNWMQGWNMSAVETGKIFSLGERGKLRLKSNLGGGALVMGWSSHSMKMAFKSRLGREPVHREYTEIDHSEEGRRAQPVPIIVISDRPRSIRALSASGQCFRRCGVHQVIQEKVDNIHERSLSHTSASPWLTISTKYV